MHSDTVTIMGSDAAGSAHCDRATIEIISMAGHWAQKGAKNTA